MGDCLIEVEWWDRHLSGGDERRIFTTWNGVAGQKYTFNSCDLRSIDVKMQPVDPIAGPPLNVVQQRAPSQRRAAQASREQIRNIAHVQRNPVAPPPEMKFEIPSAEENKVLLHCSR